MSENTFEIYYYDGIKAGLDKQEVIQKLAALLKLPEDKSERIISSFNRVIRSGLTREQAEKYLYALDNIGLQVRMQTLQGQGQGQGEDEVPSSAEKDQQKVKSEQPAQTGKKQVDSSLKGKSQLNQTKDFDHSSKSVAVKFNGTGMEYFKIWIVNIFLTIITLGIYSAWAKVRNKQYFYGNTIIDGSSFQYTATPITILKGRVIAVAIFILYSLIVNLLPLLGLLLMLILIGFIPWLIVRSLAFNARNSMYRNIRFNFTGKAIDAFKVFILWPILIIFTFGLITPLIWYKQTSFIVSNSAYGATSFNFNTLVGKYFNIFFIALGGLFGAGILLSFLTTIAGPALVVVISPLFTLTYIVFFAYLTTALSNLQFNSTHLVQHGFTSSLKVSQVSWIYFTNILLIILSLGLMIPWAMVRMARYRAECLSLQVQGSVDNFIAVEQQKVSALGDELSGVFDVEVSFI